MDTSGQLIRRLKTKILGGFFRDPVVQSLLFLESLECKTTTEKSDFFSSKLVNVFPDIPKVCDFISQYPVICKNLSDFRNYGLNTYGLF